MTLPYSKCYHDEGNYCDLSIYGKPTWIITFTKEIYDCSVWFMSRKYYGTESEMVNSGYKIHDLIIPIIPNSELNIHGSQVSITILYANFYFAPWAKQYSKKACKNSLRPDLQYYQLNTNPLFSKAHKWYFGTNYGDIWSCYSGKYLAGYNKIDSCGISKIPYKEYHLSNCELHAKAHRVSAYFVHNPDPVNYNFVCHKDNNPQNNHYSNLYWGDVKLNNQQAIDDGLAPQCTPAINKPDIANIYTELMSNSVLERTNILTKWADILNVTTKCIRENIYRQYGNNALEERMTTNKATTSETGIMYNCFHIANDYNNTCEYAVSTLRERRDIIVTKDNKIFRCIEDPDIYFPMNNKDIWPTRQALEYATYLVVVNNENPKKQLLGIKSPILSDSKSIIVSLIYRLYFESSPWYDFINGESVQYAQMNSHSDYAFMSPWYFICSNALVYSARYGKYLTPKVKHSYLASEQTLEYKGKSVTRSTQVLLEAFGFNVPDEATAKKWITSKVTSSTFF